ncbi:transcriptional regulator Kaiso [Notechis scutatus]|uniref:Transcriptional regulator Kaiso n=1 Tax=Notechis scutatus TaxID=8663 RepID=A0A6J1UI44_9SAUR|nr:transcriptional regulator Kaiso [Notechis scutatus]
MEPGAMSEAGGKAAGMETRKLITATDNQYSGMLLKALDEQRGLGLFCDVTVIVEDRKFRAHRNILSASSTYFHQLFAVAGQVVELNFIRGEVFAEILNYIYSSKIIRVRSDLLDELIKSGELLGVKFLAELGVPLQQVKNMSSEANPSSSEVPILEANGPKAQKPPALLETQSIKFGKPIITESFSLYREPCESAKITISDSEDEDVDDDVIFCSELVPSKERSVETKVITQIPPCPNPTGSSEVASSTNNHSLPQSVAPPRLDSSTVLLNPAENQKPLDVLPLPAPKTMTPNVVVLNASQVGVAPGVSSSHEIEVLPIPEENQQPSTNDSLTDMETNVIDEEEEEEDVEDDDDILGLSSPGSASSSSLVQQPTTPKPAVAADSTAVQKKQVVSFPPEPVSQPNEFKILISDVLSGGLKDTPPNVAPKHITEGQKTITLDKATEIESLSTGCKVYANIGEDTYDIVIPVKDEADGEVHLDNMPRTSGNDPNRKRLKVKHDDHYELIMDGKVYYICIVCRRSYVCLTSLRRHFNVHSWEKKYPCRYCEKVFPLAEYRTKHEIHHTGERRYQCLACGQCFINYQVMATHLRSVHSQDPSGESKLYRLHPCRSLQIRNYAYISGNSNNIPVTNDNTLVYSGTPSKETPQEPVPNQPAKPMTWDDIFVPQANESLFKQNPSDGTSEFEFVIPESY